MRERRGGGEFAKEALPIISKSVDMTLGIKVE